MLHRPVCALGYDEKHDFAFLFHGAEDPRGKPSGKGAKSGQIGAHRVAACAL